MLKMAVPIEYFPPASQLHLTSELRPPHSPPHRASTSRSLCVVCGRSMPLTKARVFRVHGPLNNRCMGSGMSPSSLTAEDSLPLSAASNASSQCSPISVPVPVSNFLSVNSSEPSTVSADEAELFLSTIRDSSRTRILKRIPRASRHLAATKLASILDDVTEKNDFSSWDRLFTFSSRCFAATKRGGQRRSLAAAVNKQLRDELVSAPKASLTTKILALSLGLLLIP